MERKKVCILGTAPTLKEAPFEDDSFEMWAVSGLMGNPDCKRIDRVFELHPWYEVRSMLHLLEMMKESDKPIYMQEVCEEVPASVRFPVEDVRKAFYLDVMGRHLYVTNTITWMTLLAILEGYQDFAFFGVHMEHESEYAYQRSSCSWALGIIHGKILAGEPLTLHLPDESALLKAQYEYGYGQPTVLMMNIDARRKRLKAGVEQTQGQMQQLHESMLKTEGAMVEANYWYDYIAGYR